MGRLRRIVRRLVSPVRYAADDALAEREVAAHLTLLEDEYRRRGQSDEQARRSARLALGGVAQTMELHRDARTFRWTVDLASDVRHAIRGFVRSSGFTTAAVLTLALGIGVNTALFSVIHTILLRPLPYRDPERLTILWERDARRGLNKELVTPGSFADWEAQSRHVFESLGYTPNWPGARSFLVVHSTFNERVAGAYASAGLFRVLGVEPWRGRLFISSDDVENGAPVALVSYRYWQGRLAGAQDVIGKRLVVDTHARTTFTIVGVLPPGFEYPNAAEIWLSAGQMGVSVPPPGSARRGGPWFEVLGRLRTGVPLERAQAEMRAIARRATDASPGIPINADVTVQRLKDHFVGSVRTVLLVLFGAVMCVLIIACVNVGNLLLSRGLSRRHELQLRAALGAGVSRIVRQLLAESVTLALAGGVAGVVVGYGCLQAITAFAPGNLPRMSDVRIDLTVLLFTAGVSILAGIGFGLAPALYARSGDLNVGLQEVGRSGSVGRRTRLQRAFVVSEIALALVLLLMAGLFGQSLSRLRNVDPGFLSDHALAVSVDLSSTAFSGEGGPDRQTIVREIIERVQRLPGVEAAGVTSLLPLSDGGWTDRPGGGWSNQPFMLEHRRAVTDTTATADPRVVTPSYFRAMGVPVRVGRTFSDADGAQGAKVVLVNEAFARRFVPGYPDHSSPIGQRLVFRRDGTAQIDAATKQPVWREIVGIVGDVRTGGLHTEPRPELYVPYAQEPWPDVALVVRSSGDARSLAAAVRQQIESVSRSVAVTRVQQLDDLVGTSLAAQRFQTLLLASFAGAALLLAALGIYATMAHAVARRTGEIGIRMALGAQRPRVLWEIAAEGAQLTGGGIVMGLVIALPLQSVARSLLYDIAATELVSMVLTTGLLLIVAMIASLIPALSATRIDPITALRTD
jgi:putative ABC transport system permease protein